MTTFGRFVLVTLIGALMVPISGFAADDAETLKSQIDSHAAQIEALNKEIAAFEKQLTVVSTAKKTLQNTLTQLDLSRKKLAALMSVTKNQIGTTEVEIQQLEKGIASTQKTIDGNQAGLAEAIRIMNQTDKVSLAAVSLSSDNLGEAWRDIDRLSEFQQAVQDRVLELKNEKQSLAQTKSTRESKRNQLVSKKTELAGQQGSLDAVRKTQSELLAQTKSKESEYQKLIAQKKAQQSQFEDALTDLKGKLSRAVSAADITAGGKGILQYPLDNVRITQKFGNTAFAASGAYNGKGHNGMDFAAPVGTPLKAARGGIILGTGNTDTVRGCYSFGKWVLIKHDNGLSTMYAHLSQIKVYAGESVTVGQVIGYSGETGYATGPHLHFGVYVTTATQIMKLGDATNSKTPCSGAVMPVAPLSGYLNPQNYF